jgi:hypothetical protein
METPDPKDLPPFFQNWQQIFAFVLASLGLFIVFLYWFSTWYR